MLTLALFPAASELEAKIKKETLCSLYSYAMKYTVLLLLPLTAVVVLLAKPFVDLWLGLRFQQAAITLQLLAVAYFFNALTAPAFYILNGIGKPKYAMFSAIIALVINLFLSISLVRGIGFLGVVIGAACSFSISSVYFLLKANREMNISTQDLIKKTLIKPLIVCLVLYSFGNFFVKRFEPFNWTILFCAGFLFMLFDGCMILALGHLDSFDKAIIKQIFARSSRENKRM